MRIRNKMLLAMFVPLALLIAQIAAVSYFIRELQSAASFIGATHAVIEADLRAAELAEILRQEVKRLPSVAAVERTTAGTEASDRRRALAELGDKIAQIEASTAIGEIEPAAAAALFQSFADAEAAFIKAEALVSDPSADLNDLFEAAIRADRALSALAERLKVAAVALRRELQAAVDRERVIHNRPLIAGIGIGAAAIMFVVAFTWAYADRHIARRITALSDSMMAIADGNLRTEIPADHRRDEIAGMGTALHGFRATALEIEEQSLRERQVVLDTIEYGVLILDAGFRVRMHNRAFRDLWNRDGHELTSGLPMRALLESVHSRGLHNAGAVDWADYVDQRLAEIEAADAPPQEWRRPDGRVLQYEVVKLPEGGRMLTYFDLTRLKEVEAELRTAKEDAELASRAKSDFLASMSHELRTPLNAIIGITEMLKEDAEVDGDAHLDEPLARVLRAGRLLLQLINEVLDLAKIEAGKLELQPEDTDLRSLLDSVVETAEPLAEKNRNALVVEADADLGRGNIDSMRLRQIVLNLLSNACKFTREGRVVMAADRHGDMLEVSVRDTGIGIEADQLPFLFQEFHQAGAAKHRKYGGTGLGLAISRRLVTLMGGEIGATSVIGVGSTFTVTLPVTAVVPVAVPVSGDVSAEAA